MTKIIVSPYSVFEVGSQTIVNTVNCVGVMGAGLAHEMCLRYPLMFAEYKHYCDAGKVKVGKTYVSRTQAQWVLNFPTKNHWRYPSKLEWIASGLQHVAENYKAGKIESLAVPKLGCSKGNLRWSAVEPLIQEILSDLTIPVYICLDEERAPNGIETKMLQYMAKTNSWLQVFTVRQQTTLQKIEPLKLDRFRNLQRLNGISKQMYEKLFTTIYQSVQEKQINPKVTIPVSSSTASTQLKLF